MSPIEPPSHLSDGAIEHLRAAVEELRDAALGAFGSVHLVCNNAGLGFPKPMIEATPDDWDLVMDVNVRGVVNGVDAFLPLFVEQGSGHVSATASISGLIADPGLSLYNASKMAVVGMLEGRDRPRPDRRGAILVVLSSGHDVRLGGCAGRGDERRWPTVRAGRRLG